MASIVLFFNSVKFYLSRLNTEYFDISFMKKEELIA